MALKNIKHWSWGLLRSMLVGAGDSMTIALGLGAANAFGITMPALTLKQGLGILALSAGRSLFKYLKENPIPEETES